MCNYIFGLVVSVKLIIYYNTLVRSSVSVSRVRFSIADSYVFNVVGDTIDKGKIREFRIDSDYLAGYFTSFSACGNRSLLFIYDLSSRCSRAGR